MEIKETIPESLERIASIDPGREARETLARGIAIYYGDEQHAPNVIKEHPNGLKQLVNFNEDGNEYVIRTLKGM